MSFEGVIINPGQGGLNRTNPSTDGVMALVACTTSAGDNAFNTVYTLNSLKAAEDLGFNAAYDSNEEVLVHHHISEFFRLAPDGTLKLIVTVSETAAAFFALAGIKAA